jgi:Flp pilus assembly protein TadD
MSKFARLSIGALLTAALACAQPAYVLLESGLSQLRAKKYEEAEATLRRSYSMDGSARALDGLAEALVGLGKKQEALDLVTAAVKKEPRRTALRLSLGNTAVRTGDLDLAIEQFGSLIKDTSDPQFLADLYNRLGETYRMKGDFPQAVAALRKAREKSPQSPAIAANLATALDSAGEKQEAIGVYRSAIAMEPNNPLVMNNLAFAILTAGGDLDEALRLALRAHQLLPDLAEVDDTLGAIYVKRHETDKALEVAQLAVQKNPSQAAYRNTLADALDQLDSAGTEIQELKTLLRSMPTPENSQRVLELLPSIKK